MQPIGEWLAGMVPSLVSHPSSFLVDAVLKGTVLMLLGVAAQFALRRSSAAVRHRGWGLMFVGLLLLPLLSYALPQWRVPILPPAASAEGVVEPELAGNPAAWEPAVDASAKAQVSPMPASSDPLTDPALSPFAATPPEFLEQESDLQREVDAATATPLAVGRARATNSWTAAARTFWAAVLIVWTTGTFIVLLPLATSIVRNTLLWVYSARVEDTDWTSLLEELRSCLRLRRRVDLLASERPLVPMTWGLVRPVVLLPDQARDWTVSLRRFVLLHELAHVKRWDVGFQMVARLACALYWCHPLVWYAMRRLRIERELASDDCVVMAGERPADYAQQLLEIARTYRPTGLVSAVAMAQSAGLEHRIRALLDRARSRMPLSPRSGALLLIASLAMVTGVAVIQPAAQDSVTEAAEIETQAAPLELLPSEPPTDEADAEHGAITLTGRVLDPSGRPIEARLFIVRTFVSQDLWEGRNKILADRQTLADGRFTVTFPADDDHFSDGANLLHKTTQIVATASGHGPQWEAVNVEDPKTEFTLTMPRDTVPIEGRVLNLEGQPIAGVRVRPRLLQSTESSLDDWIVAARDNPASIDRDAMMFRARLPSEPAREIARFPAGPQLHCNSLPFATEAITDANGRFRLTGFGADRRVELRLDGPTMASLRLPVVTRRFDPLPMPVVDPRERTNKCFGATFTVTVEPSQKVFGRVKDQATGQPLVGAEVHLNQYGESRLLAEGFLSATTDAEGRFELTGVPKPGDGDRQHRLRIELTDGPYFAAEALVPRQNGLDPVELDVELQPGIWVTGRVTDGETGQPVPALVSYFPLLSNEHAERYAYFNSGVTTIGSRGSRATDPAGRFRVVGIPGRGVVRAVASDSQDYRRGVAAEAIDGLLNEEGQLNLYHFKSPGFANAFAPVDAAVDQEQVEISIELEPFDRVEVRLVDPIGEPITGVRVGNRTVHPIQRSFQAFEPATATDAIQVVGLSDEVDRAIILHHEGRQLGRVISAGSLLGAGAQPRAISLYPSATLRGRLINAEKQSLSGHWVTARAEAVDSGQRDRAEGATRYFASEGRQPSVQTDGEGRFELPLLVGGKYKVGIPGGAYSTRELIEDLSVEAGEQIDLGTIDTTADPATWPKPKRVPAPTAATGNRNATLAVPVPGARQSADNGSVSKSLTVRGRVLLPDGSPAANAIVQAAAPMYATLAPLLGEDYEPAVSRTRTDEQGRFSVDFTTRPFGDPSQFGERWGDLWKQTRIAASLAGYGPQWVIYEEIENPREPITLQLVEDLPIVGRLIDLEGRPVTGVSIKIGGPQASPDENLTAWLEGVKQGEVPWTIHKHTPRSIEPKLIGVPAALQSDSSGRFTIRGVGIERHFSFSIEGEAVSHRAASVATRRMQPIQRVISAPPFEGTETVYGAEFTMTASPARPITGTVRDADSGAPLPGVAVESYKFADYPYSGHAVVKTVTDQEGRYRLIGMPKGDGNQLFVRPNDDQPYLMRRVDVPNPAGLGPAVVDIELHRGIWITGRITDKNTGAAVHGARVYYLPFRSNTFAQALPEFDDSGNVDGDQTRYQSKADGTYRLVGLPGRAIVGARSVHKRYRTGVGYDAIDGPKYRDTDYLDTYRNPVYASPKWPDVMAEINPPAAAKTVALDLQLDPGLTVPIRMVGPDERSVTDVEVTGASSGGYTSTVSDDRFDATQFRPDETRTMLFRHAGNRLGLAARVSPRDLRGKDTEITVRLQPTATLLARLLHSDGSPMTGAEVEASPLPVEDFSPRLPSVTTDSAGRFRLPLLPGAAYSVSARGASIDTLAEIARMLTIEPGEEKALGDLRLDGRNLVAAVVNVSQQTSTLLKLQGRVLDPDGLPYREASVWVRHPLATEWTRLARTFNNGQFDASIDRSRLSAAIKEDPDTKVRLAATAKGHGIVWRDFEVSELAGQVELQLREDLPIEGRLVTMEGKPAAGVDVIVTSVPLGNDDGGSPDDAIDRMIASAQGSSGVYFNTPPTVLTDPPDIRPTVTDTDGRFRVEGLGTGRMVRLEATGGGIGATRLAVITRPPPANRPDGMIAVKDRGLAESVYFARFTHIAAPGRTLRGRVIDASTSEPIAGVRVKTYATWWAMKNAVLTDADGRYEIPGVPKADEYRMVFESMASPHFHREIHAADTKGFEPLEIDAELQLGIVVQGRVTEDPAGRPLAGTVFYNPLLPNPHWSRLGKRLQIANPAARSAIQEDGTYEISVLPGPGVVAATVRGDNFLSAEVDSDLLRNLVGEQNARPNLHGAVRFLTTAAGDQAGGLMSLNSYQAAEIIDPGPDVTKLDLDLKVVVGRSRAGRIEDDRGRRIAGASVIGLGPSAASATREPLKTADFSVSGLGPGRERILLFVHHDRNLGARMVITGDDAAPVTAKMTPTGTITGRFVDKLGEPVSGVVVELGPQDPPLQTPFWLGESDEKGRFQVTGLIADTSYRISAKPRELPGPSRWVMHVTVAAGETRDLGSFTEADEYRYRRIVADDSRDDGDRETGRR